MLTVEYFGHLVRVPLVLLFCANSRQPERLYVILAGRIMLSLEHGDMDTPSSMKVASVFPQELFDNIIDHFYDDMETLKRCSLVCKSWLPSTSLHLLHAARWPSPALEYDRIYDGYIGYPKPISTSRHISEGGFPSLFPARWGELYACLQPSEQCNRLTAAAGSNPGVQPL